MVSRVARYAPGLIGVLEKQTGPYSRIPFLPI